MQKINLCTFHVYLYIRLQISGMLVVMNTTERPPLAVNTTATVNTIFHHRLHKTLCHNDQKGNDNGRGRYNDVEIIDSTPKMKQYMYVSYLYIFHYRKKN